MKLKDNKIYRVIIIPVCFALALLMRFIPAPDGLSQDAMGVIGIFISSLILWLTIGIDWPSLLCIFSLGLLENLTFGQVFASSFGNSTFVFLLFTFVCTYSLSKTPLLKRFALWFISSKLAKKSGWSFSFLFLFSVLILGCFISPSVLFVVMLPILNEILHIANIEKGEKAGKMLMIGLAFTISISSGMTPIAHVFPILALNAAKLSISYVKYMLFGIPVGILCFLCMMLIFKLILRPDLAKLNHVDVSVLKENMPPLSKEEKVSFSIFCIVLTLWIIPSILQNYIPALKTFITNNWGDAIPPLLGTIALCIIRVNNKPLIKVDEALKNGIPWTSLLMCAATLALGSAMTNPSIGLKEFLQSGLYTALLNIPSIALLIIFTLWAMLQTNVSSNMVTATLVSTVAASVLGSINNLSLNITAVICLIGMISAFAFATPPSMPHIAIASSSGYADTKSVLAYGSILMICSLIIILVVGYPLASIVI